MNAAAEQRFVRLCGKRYREVKIDPDFQVWVRESETGELRSADQLSRGTQDQLYFAIRFGILDLVSNEAEPCPCLLDEPFAGIDPIAVRDIHSIVSHLREMGIGVLITDHNVRDTLKITDRAYIINDGEILRSGDPASLSMDPEVRKIYLGEDFVL